jgi:hypothetical protein
MGKCARRTRLGLAGIVATVIMFAIIFTVGTSYFIFVGNENSQYVQNLVSASNKLQGSLGESLSVTSILISSNGDIGYYVNDTSGLNANVTTALLLSSTGQILACVGKGLAAGTCAQQSSTFAACTNTSCSTTQSPAPSYVEVSAGRGSPAVDTGYVPVSGFTYVLKVATQRGNTYSQTYPETSSAYANQAQTSGAVEVNMASFKWVHLVAQATSLVQTGFKQNCNSASCGTQFGSSVAAGDLLVYGLGWYGNSPPSTPTDTLGSSWRLSASTSASSAYVNPALVQTAYQSNCASATCGKGFGSNVASGDLLVYGLGWFNSNPPSTPTDTLGSSFSLGASSSVGASATPAVVQHNFNNNCNASACSQAFTNSVANGDLLVYALGWPTLSPPSTPTDTLGDTFTLGASQSVTAPTTAPTLSNRANPVSCNTSTCSAGFGGGNVAAGDVLIFTIGWYSQSTAPTISDTLGNSFTLGNSQSVTAGAVTYYSYIYYATSAGSGTDSITATFSGSTNAMASAYDVSGVTATSPQITQGNSASSGASSAVTSFAPVTNSFVVASVEATGPTAITNGAGYAIPGGPAPCNTQYGCSESETGAGTGTTAPFNFSPNEGYAEVAIAFAPSAANYYSYVWYATAKAEGADTITSLFSSAAQASESLYEVNGASTSGILTSSGTSPSGSNVASVTSYTPSSGSFVVANAETQFTNTNFGAGGGYTIIQGGGAGCGKDEGCSEYETASGSPTTSTINLGNLPGGGGGSTPWVEVSIAFAPGTNNFYSYLWYATAAGSGSDTISASFSAAVVGSVSIYEISGATTAGHLTSTGSSTSPTGTSSVTQFTPNLYSFVVANSESDGGETFTAGSGYALAGSCNGVYGCAESQAGPSATTAPMSMSPNSPFVEAAISFGGATRTYYSYIWTAVAAASGTDTVTALFSQTAVGTVSVYELNGYSSSSIMSSTGSSTTSATASVTSFTPSAQSFVMGNVESAYSTESFTAGSGYTVISGGGGGCGAAYGCSEYLASSTGSTTTPLSLATQSPWVEAAISLSAPINPQSGVQVGGYPTVGIPTGAQIVFEATFTNADPQERTITLWPQSVISVTSIENTGNADQANFFIVDSLNAAATTIVPYGTTTGNFLTLAYNVPTTLYFGSATPQGNQTVAIDNNVDGPFYAFFSLSGLFSNNQLLGQTIPFPYGIITGANAYTTPTAGAHGSTATMSCTGSGGSCGFNACPSVGQPGPGGPGNCQKDTGAQNAFIAWIDSGGKVTTLTTFRTTSTGGLPSNLQFTVPSTATPGYYTVMVSDYENTVFMTFQVTS